MTLDISTPALLFPAISLLLLAYTNRFLTTAQLIRGLSANVREGEVSSVELQIENLKKRMDLIKLMQLLGVGSLLVCTISMFFIFIEYHFIGNTLFVVSLILMCGSLITSIKEISISTGAIETELDYIHKKDLFHKNKKIIKD